MCGRGSSLFSAFPHPPLPFLPQALAIRDDIAAHPSAFWQNRSRDNGVGSFHHQWLQQWGTFGSEPHLFCTGAMTWGCVQLRAGMVTKVRISLIPHSSNNFELFCRPGGNGLGALYKEMCHTPDA